MSKARGSSLADIFADEPTGETPIAAPVPEAPPLGVKPKAASAAQRRRAAPQETSAAAPAASVARDSHPGKKPVLIHIPADMHRILRQLSVEEGGEPITKVVERSLREYLVKRGHTRFA